MVTSSADGTMSSTDGNVVGRWGNVVGRWQRSRQNANALADGNGQKATTLAEGNIVGRQQLRHGFFFTVPQCFFTTMLIYQYIHCIKALVII